MTSIAENFRDNCYFYGTKEVKNSIKSYKDLCHFVAVHLRKDWRIFKQFSDLKFKKKLVDTS